MIRYDPIKIKLNFKKRPDFNLNINGLVGCEERNDQIIDQVIIAADEGRQILVLSQRCDKVPHLHVMQEILKTKRPDIRSSLFYGKTKKADRAEAMKAKVVFSSFHMASEALDIPSLSAVALTTPSSSIEQAIARGIRGKYQLFDPVIMYFRDRAGIWQKYWKSASKFFREEGFEFQYTVREGKEEEDDCPFSVDDEESCIFSLSSSAEQDVADTNKNVQRGNSKKKTQEYKSKSSYRNSLKRQSEKEEDLFLCPFRADGNSTKRRRKTQPICNEGSMAPESVGKDPTNKPGLVNTTTSFQPTPSKPTLSKRLNKKLGSKTFPKLIL